VDYWEKVSGNWTLKTINGVSSADFGASFMGTAVPEPSTIAWVSLYGVAAHQNEPTSAHQNETFRQERFSHSK
jgi:hypothetical protein